MLHKRYISRFKSALLTKTISCLVLTTFFTTSIIPAQAVSAQSLGSTQNFLSVSPVFKPAVLQGVIIHPEDPLKFDFIVNSGDSELKDVQLREETRKLIKYFVASLATSEKDMWVNLSPYEPDRIVPQQFGQTEMGRDMLAQDYLLKKITSSLMYPEDEVGKKFWDRVYQLAYEKYGTTEIPVDTFNKVWIVPQETTVYENAKTNTVFVSKSVLDVMLEGDYLAKSASDDKREDLGFSQDDLNNAPTADVLNEMAKNVVREIILPELKREVNEGQNFAPLRQIMHSLILANWYKNALKNSILTQAFANQNKIDGAQATQGEDKQAIYEQYVQAFQQGAYDVLKEDYDPAKQEMVAKKYFSGGITQEDLTVANAMLAPELDSAALSLATTDLAPQANVDDAQLTEEEKKVALIDELIIAGYKPKALNGSTLATLVTLYESGSIPNTVWNPKDEYIAPLGNVDDLYREVATLKRDADYAQLVSPAKAMATILMLLMFVAKGQGQIILEFPLIPLVSVFDGPILWVDRQGNMFNYDDKIVYTHDGKTMTLDEFFGNSAKTEPGISPDSLQVTVKNIAAANPGFELYAAGTIKETGQYFTIMRNSSVKISDKIDNQAGPHLKVFVGKDLARDIYLTNEGLSMPVEDFSFLFDPDMGFQDGVGLHVEEWNALVAGASKELIFPTVETPRLVQTNGGIVDKEWFFFVDTEQHERILEKLITENILEDLDEGKVRLKSNAPGVERPKEIQGPEYDNIWNSLLQTSSIYLPQYTFTVEISMGGLSVISDKAQMANVLRAFTLLFILFLAGTKASAQIIEPYFMPIFIGNNVQWIHVDTIGRFTEIIGPDGKLIRINHSDLQLAPQPAKVQEKTPTPKPVPGGSDIDINIFPDSSKTVFADAGGRARQSYELKVNLPDNTNMSPAEREALLKSYVEAWGHKYYPQLTVEFRLFTKDKDALLISPEASIIADYSQPLKGITIVLNYGNIDYLSPMPIFLRNYMTRSYDGLGSPKVTADNAALGGIDLEKTNVVVENRGEGTIQINFKDDPAMLERLRNATGLKAVIRNIQPLTIPAVNGLLGKATTDSNETNLEFQQEIAALRES